jgi:hypothetical protein
MLENVGCVVRDEQDAQSLERWVHVVGIGRIDGGVLRVRWDELEKGREEGFDLRVSMVCAITAVCDFVASVCGDGECGE